VLPNLILVINPIINFVIYEGLKKFMLKNKYPVNAGQLLLISSFAKTIATIFTYPFLTIRVRMQAEKEKRRCGLLISIFKMIKELGLEGLYLGIYAKLFQTVLYNAFLMLTYEKLRMGIKYMVFIYL
jgi:adenine nucleotide transporter 17